MELQLRPPAYRLHPLVRPWSRRGFAGLHGLGQGTCQVPQPGVPMVYPPCPTYGPVAPDAPASYVAPKVTGAPACSSSPDPWVANSAECIAQLLANQQADMAAAAAANRKVFVADCESAWAENAQRYRDLGMAVPPNDCAYRTYGQTLPGQTGGSSGYLHGTPQAILDWRNANPGGGSPGPAAGSSSTPAATLVLSFTNLTSGANSNFKVGDRWQLQISGAAPNQPVSVSGGLNGANALTQMGSTDGSGRFALNGQMTQDQIGNWAEVWKVGDQTAGSFQFKVAPAASPSGTGTAPRGGTRTGGPASSDYWRGRDAQILHSLISSVDIGGSAIPIWALGLGAAALFFFMRGK